jgi:L-alanine-DL-glutamate epimerase-like enolase superfamily enzyme
MAGVEFIEQPLAWDDLEGYRALSGRCPLPLVLDESIRDPLSVEVFGEYADAVNLKISKLGGISACRAVAQRAMRSGLDLMMGCMIESSLGIAQALQLGSLLRWADLDGCLLIESDPHRGLGLEGDHFEPGAGPGLGVERRG